MRSFREIDLFNFLASAAALYPYFHEATRLGMLGRIKGSLGRLILGGCRASLDSQRGGNTHLGAILLMIPLAAAAGSAGLEPPIAGRLRKEAVKIVKETGWRDASLVLEAIRITSPGGLGRVPFLDVNNPSTYRLVKRRGAGLIEVFEPYLGRDLIADELVRGFPTVFGICLRGLWRWEKVTGRLESAFVNALLEVISKKVDTHVVRRKGLQVARIVQGLASDVLSEGGVQDASGLRLLSELDDYLRRVDARPGSSADILAAAIGVRMLEGLRP